MCIQNANNTLKSVGCENRDFYAGKVNGLDEIINITNIIKNADFTEKKA